MNRINHALSASLAIGALLATAVVASAQAVVIPAGFAAPASAVNTNKPGFKVRTVVTPTGSVGDSFVNGPIANLEAVLNLTAIDPNTGVAFVDDTDPNAPVGPDTSVLGADGYWGITNVINLDIVDNFVAGAGTGHGNFTSGNGYLADPFPGVPGLSGQTADFAVEVLAYLQLKAGTNHFIVNSDDDFKLTIGYGTNPKDAFAQEIGEFTGGRGATDTAMDVVIPSDGFYATRLIYGQGGGDANLEFINVVNGVDLLVNDSTNSVKAYQAAPTGTGGPYAISVTPSPGTKTAPPNVTVDIELQDGSLAAVVTNGIVLKLDGTTVVPSVSKLGAVTSVKYTPTAIFEPSSVHTLEFIFADSSSVTNDRTWSFTVAGVIVPPSLAVTGVDTTKPGFKVRTYQVDGGQPNTIVWTEEMLAGLHGPNIADLGQIIDGQPIDANGFYTYTDVINWDKEGGADGNFTSANGYTDITLPGQPDPVGGSYNNDAEEVLAFVFFPAAGVYTMGVNSDDGFQVSIGANPRDIASSIVAGVFNGGRGASDTTFQMVIQQSGYYPFRLLWENGGSGANCEWFSVQNDGTKVLINDPSPTNTTGIKAYYSGPPAPGYLSAFQSTVTNVTAIFKDQGTVIDKTSLKLSLNGTNVPATVSKTTDTTTVTYSPPAPFASGSTNVATLIYRDNIPNTYTDTVTFVIIAYPTLPGTWTVTGVDTNKPGFKVKPYQVASGQPNTIVWTEQMLAGQHGTNIADLTQTIDGQPIDSKGYYTYTDVINWDKAGGADGNFTDANGYTDITLPGQPDPVGGSYNNDAEEVLTYLQFATPGFYTMGVNSDDGFIVTAGPNPAVYPPAAVLGEFIGGRGSSDTTFTFLVAQAGIYPFRLLWENGGSGANCEWFSVQGDGSKVLINDPSPTNTTGIKAFYSAPVVVTPPVMSVKSNADGSVTISWTETGTLQQATTLAPPANWTPVTPAPSGSSYTTTPGAAPANLFFRLVQ